MYEIYSVESRKGGVGKTTIALNLAKALVKKKYDVLLIDCDITGTPITMAAQNSPFWKNDVKVVCDDESVPQNLIGYYEKKYLSGRKIGADFNLCYEKGKIHLCGSEIYNEDGDLIIDPRNLMDDLHSYWFVSMIKDLAGYFSDVSDGDKVAIVLDNSPGYVGIGRSLREWLTAVGPEYAHFLLVSSLDEQDVDSTISSATEIMRLMDNKLALAKYYCEKNPSGTEIDNILSSNKSLSDFYYALAGGEEYPSNTGKSYSLNDYVKVIVNKVPNDYLDEGKGYHFKDFNKDDRKKIIKETFPLDQGGYPSNIIGYDNSISGQFIESSIERPTASTGLANLQEEFKRFLIKLSNYKGREDKYNYTTQLIKAFHSVIDKLITAGYKRMANTFTGNMMPETNVVEMAENVRMLGNMAYSKMDKGSFSKDGMIETTKQQMRAFISDFGLTEYSSVLLSQLEGIYKKAGAERKNGNVFQIFNLTVLMRLIINRQRKYYNKKESYRVFLKKEIISANMSAYDRDIIHEQHLQIDDEKLIRVDMELTEMMNVYFRNFYPSYCYSLLKMIDCSQDFELIVDACVDTIKNGARVFSNELDEYLRDVVVSKKKDFSESEYRKLISEPFEMKSIQNLLSKHVLSD